MMPHGGMLATSFVVISPTGMGPSPANAVADETGHAAHRLPKKRVAGTLEQGRSASKRL